jgi:septum formation protein
MPLFRVVAKERESFMKVILASKSPRRKELLGRLFDEFEIITKDVDESVEAGVLPKEAVEILAVRKGGAVYSSLTEDALVISSDTLVEFNGKALGKPENEEEAIAMLGALSGNTHSVHTGVAVHYRGKVFSGVASSFVRFHKLDEGEILDYVKTGEPMDKAGAYGIQGEAGKFVSGYDGDFDTIVGLSLTLTKALVDKAEAEA